MFGWLKKLFGQSKPAVQRHGLRAKYDAAQPNGINERHFRASDDLSARAANSPEVRYKLRKFSRYEVANNSYAKGIALTWANEVVGRGPRLQMRTADREANRQVERNFGAWMLASGLAEKLHTLVQAKVVDGEGCAILQSNPLIDHPVKLDLFTIEADQLATPSWMTVTDQNTVDGIVYDSYGNPTEYHVLKNHPGDTGYLGAFDPNGYDRIPAKNFVHWYRVDRPGQCRGVPEFTPAIGLFAQLRRWTLAVLTGAETAASFAAILHSKGAADTTPQADPWEEVEINIGTMTTLPEGWEMSQFDAKQPAGNYVEFKRELLKEIARCMNMPLNVISGDSSLYNYASGRLDYQNWYRAIKVTRASFERVVMEHIFREWLLEAELLGLLPEGVTAATCPHGWFFDSVPHVDPVKDGTGDSLALANCTDTLADICAAQGKDWEEVLGQRSIELKRQKELGLGEFLPSYTMQMQKDIAEANDKDSQDERNGKEPQGHLESAVRRLILNGRSHQ